MSGAERVLAEIPVPTAARMRDLGRRLAALLRAGDLLVLSGPLGAGKTTLVQGIADRLGVRGPVTSPTFVIPRTHPSVGAGPALVPPDAYRLGSPAEGGELRPGPPPGSPVGPPGWRRGPLRAPG